MIDLVELRRSYRAHQVELLDKILINKNSTSQVTESLKKISDLADKTLCAIWEKYGLDEPLALLAVGGFGRRELYPYSDVDVLILLTDDINLEAQTDLKNKLELFISSCWDTGLEIGSSVRSITQCLEESKNDITVQTSILESRLIAGSSHTNNTFQKYYFQHLNPQNFFIAKNLELQQRHHKYESTPYSLEPNCKESPGGLRDLQIILWVSKAARFGQSWDELAKNGLATRFEISQLKKNEATLRIIRTRLHLIAKRREDRLVFDLQHAVAESFGYSPKEITSRTDPSKKAFIRPSEALMKRYYWAAKAVTQLNQILMLNIQGRLYPKNHSLQKLNERFFDNAGLLEVASDDLYHLQPNAILETFLIYQETVGIKGLSTKTLRALYNAREIMDGEFRRSPENRATFLKILTNGEGLTHAIRLMNQTSVLGRYLWVFRKIVGQMQHDLFHVYTVDQHILMVLRNVRRFFIPEHAHEYTFCSQLAVSWEKPWLLYVAALFHDIAKGRGGDHSELGGVEARRFCKQHNISKEDTDLIEFLVTEHLTMSRIAQKSDLSDPLVISEFVKKIKTERYLTGLYLLTVADIRGTSPKVWNAWKGKLLEDLYRFSLRALGGKTLDAQTAVGLRKKEALVELALHAKSLEETKKLWKTFDVSYFMRHDANDIAWHTLQILKMLDTQKTIVQCRISPLGEGLQVLVYTPDQTDLFARICGYFDQASFDILDARIHTANNGYALDTFQIISDNQLENLDHLILNIEAELTEFISQKTSLPEPSKGRLSRRVKSFPITPRVTLSPDEKSENWLLNVSTSDRMGLLYSISLVLAKHKISLQLAKIATLGERVDDTFLIQGSELQNNRMQISIETELLKAIA